MRLFDRFGPNSKQVERFIERISALTAKEREMTEMYKALTRSAFGEKRTYEVEVASRTIYGRDEPEKFFSAAGKKLWAATASCHPLFRLRAQEALMALCICKDVMDAGEFAAWYGPFEVVIPVESLGEGFAPKITPPSLYPPENFLTRVRRLDNWGAVRRAHDMVVTASGGPERHQAAFDAAEEILSTKPKSPSWEEEVRKSLGIALDALKSLGDARTETTAKAWSMMGRFYEERGSIDAKDWEQQMGTWRQGQADFNTSFQHVCFDGLLAVSLVGKIDDEHYCYLYAPFEAVIPLDSLLFPCPFVLP